MRCSRGRIFSPQRSPHGPGAASIGAIERVAQGLVREGRVHDAPALKGGDGLTTDVAVARERETIALMRAGSGRGKAAMRGWMVERYLRKGPLTAGQKQAVKLILSEKDRTVGVQGYAGAGKTRMLDRARTLAAKKGWRVLGLAPSASAVRTLEAESGIKSETLQRFLARNAGLAESRLTKGAARKMHTAFARTVLVVDEGSLASTAQARDLLRIAGALRIPKLMLVGDTKQLEAVDAGKPFAQLQAAGMKTAVMDEILRQRDPDLKAAVEATLAGDISRAFEKMGDNVAEVNPKNIAGAVAARWLKLSPEVRERTGVMSPGHELREAINAHIRERLVREGRIAGPALETRRLVSKGYTNAEKALAANYAPGDVVAFPPILQEARGREGRGAARPGCGSRARGRPAGRPRGLVRGLEARPNRRKARRDRGLPHRNHRASRGRPGALDPERQGAGAREQRHGGGFRGPEWPGHVHLGGRQKARPGPGRYATAPSRPRLGLDRARLSGAHGG